MPERIAIFPLELVLLPGETVPLHIFEPRYKLLVRRVLQGQEQMGINLVLEGHLHEVGCRAEVARVLRRYRDGRMDIAVLGQERYRLQTLDEISQPYWVGHVEWITDEADPQVEPLQAACLALYERLLLLLRGSPAAVEELLQDARHAEPLSFYLARQLGLEPLQRQHLLQMRSEHQRLQWLQEYFQALLPRLEEMERISRRIRSNGHFPG